MQRQPLHLAKAKTTEAGAEYYCDEKDCDFVFEDAHDAESDGCEIDAKGKPVECDTKPGFAYVKEDSCTLDESGAAVECKESVAN